MTTLLTVTEAAARLGVSPQRVRMLIKRGRLCATRAGARLWLIAEDDVAKFRRLPYAKYARGRNPSQDECEGR